MKDKKINPKKKVPVFLKKLPIGYQKKKKKNNLSEHSAASSDEDE